MCTDDINKDDLEKALASRTPVYQWFINKNERGEFNGDVRDPDGRTVWETEGFEVFEDGFMRGCEDIKGLAEYLRDLGILPAGAKLEKGQ